VNPTPHRVYSLPVVIAAALVTTLFLVAAAVAAALFIFAPWAYMGISALLIMLLVGSIVARMKGYETLSLFLVIVLVGFVVTFGILIMVALRVLTNSQLG